MSAPKKRRLTAARLFKRLIAAPFIFLAAVIILLEDWLWDDLARLAAAIGRLPVFAQIEILITKLPPYGALVLFGAPSLLLVPVKLLALYFISHGRPTLGLLTVLLAKFAGTALVARLFTLTRPKLLRINWFAWLYERFVAFKARMYAVIKATAVYRITHRQYERLRAALKAWMTRRRGFWRRRWDAAMRRSRRVKGAPE